MTNINFGHFDKQGLPEPLKSPARPSKFGFWCTSEPQSRLYCFIFDSDNKHKPIQSLDNHDALLQELQGEVSDSIARQLLDELPPLTAPSVIHDNGCGCGAVTMAALEDSPTASLQILAIDVNPVFLAQMQAKPTENPLRPIKIDTIDACNFTFAGNTFDLSIINFVFAGLPDDVAAASHILRTLKPGGTGVIAFWKEKPWHVALEKAHHKTREAEEPLSPFLSKSRYKRDRIEQVAKDARWK